MSGTTTPPLYQPTPAASQSGDPHALLSLVLSLLERTSTLQRSSAQQTAEISTARCLTRGAQESLSQAKADVEGARGRVEDKGRALAGVRAQRRAVGRLAGELGAKDVRVAEDDPLFEGMIFPDDFLRDGPVDVLASLPPVADPEYEPALLEARLQHHLGQIAERQGEITSLEDALKAVRKENDALRKQHAVADHHLADLGKVVDKVASALEQAERLASQA